MVSKKCVLLTATAALVESALGFNYRRHGHQHIDKRAYETDWVTEWVTVWVTAGQDAAAVPTTEAGSNKYKNKGTTTSTTVVVVPTSTSVAYVAPAQTTSVAYVAPAQTTLTKALKPETTAAAVVYSSSSVEEVAAVADLTSAVVVEEVAATTQKAAATTTTKKAAAATTASSSSSSGLSHKRGMAYTDGALANTFGASCPNCGWGYGWSSVPQSSGSVELDSAFNFIPMLWGTESMHTEGWDTNAAAAISSGSYALFSFNEPDIDTQANLTAIAAATGHVQYLNPYAGQAKIGAPAVSNSGNEDEGLSWLSSWIDTCKTLDEPCHYDFCNIHWYSQAAYTDTLFTQLEAAYDLCGKPIWLTEFAPTGASDSEVSAFFEEVIPKLEALDYVEGYSYFMVATGNLMSSESSLSSYGQVYASASA